MENHSKSEKNSSWLIVPALIIGMITGWIVWGTIGAVLLGGILGMLTAGFWFNVVMNREEA